MIEVNPLSQRPGGAFGLWAARLQGLDGQVHTGGGLSREQAIHNAELRAATPCEECGRLVKPAEAQVSLRALGSVRCWRCRSVPDVEPDQG